MKFSLGRTSKSHSMATLRDIYDAIPEATIDKWDGYIEIYNRLFSSFRRAPISILEIGVFRGGSLRLWQKYFCPKSIVVGIDCDAKATRFQETGISIEIGDQSDWNFLKAVVKKYGGFDIVIDDGGHKWGQQMSAFTALYEATRSLYVVEDTHTSLWDKYKDTESNETFLSFAKSKIDLLYEYFALSGSSEAFYERDARKIEVSPFRNETHSIEFFDSMIVFKKIRNPPPFRRILKKIPE